MDCVTLAHGSESGAAVDGQNKGRSRMAKDNLMVDVDGQLEVSLVRCYEWKCERVRSSFVAGGAGFVELSSPSCLNSTK